MFAGHFGFAARVKSNAPEVPLWALMLSTQLLDVIFVPLYMAGIETMVPIGNGGYGQAYIHANYSHSLVGALIISLLAGWFASKRWGRRGGTIIGSVVFSHWLFDLLVHHPDLPILPGNLGGLPLLGLGLWHFPVVSLALEGALVGYGLLFYFLSIVPGTKGKSRKLALVSVCLVGICLVMSLMSSILGWA